MITESLSRRIEALALSPTQSANAKALLSALEGSALDGIGPEDISIHPYTHAISLFWQANGEWDDVQVDVVDDHFESYLSRDKELRIKHWPADLRLEVLKELVDELREGMT